MFARNFFLLAAVCLVVNAPAQHPANQGSHRETFNPSGWQHQPLATSHARSKSGGFRFNGFNVYQVNVDSHQMNIVGDAANEPSLAVNPLNPKSIAVGWREFDSVLSDFRQGGNGYSTDSGKTWHNNPVLNSDPIDGSQFRSDPVLSFNSTGTFYYNSLPIIPQYNWDFANEVWSSANGGATWGGPTYAYGGDKQWITVDRTNGPGAGNVYCNWSYYTPYAGYYQFTRSTDGAASFEYPVAVPTQPTFGTLAVGPDGEVYVGGAEPYGWKYTIARSDNARYGLTPVTFEFSTEVDLGGTQTGGGLNPDGLLGQAWVQVAPDKSAYRGHVYMLGTSALFDSSGNVDWNQIHVMFARSSDQGVTWSAPVRVDPPSPAGSDNIAWFGTMGVAPNGRIDVVYNSTGYSNAFGSFTSVCLYTASYDDGVTWTTPVQFTPAWDPQVGWPVQQKIGDYYDIVSRNGGPDVAFAATFNGEEDVYFVHLTPPTVGP